MITNGSSLLIVDDDECQRWLLQKAFERAYASQRVYGLASGNEAVAYLEGKGKYADRTAFPFPSSVVTDLKMPDGDGFVILEFLKSNPSLSVAPVIVLSCSDDPDDVRQAYLLGAKSFFVKPSGQPALEALARKIHDYWTACEIPAVDQQGYAIETNSRGKLGGGYPNPKGQQLSGMRRVRSTGPCLDGGTPGKFPRPARTVPPDIATKAIANPCEADASLT
jgi:CheY-like chemotaxis protein